MLILNLFGFYFFIFKVMPYNAMALVSGSSAFGTCPMVFLWDVQGWV